MSGLSTAACLALVCALIIQTVFLFKKNTEPEPFSGLMVLLAALLLLAALANRSVQIGFPALTGTFEVLLCYAALVCAVSAAYQMQRRIPRRKVVNFVLTIITLVFLALASSPLFGKEAHAPVPALRSHWLLIHVSLALAGEAFFALSFAAALASLFTRRQAKRPDYERIVYTSIAAGYPLFTAGALVFGAVWAQQAWGRWWGWDPKETWALITWLVYTLYLHLRLVFKKNGRLLSLVAALGFLCTVFTFFGGKLSPARPAQLQVARKSRLVFGQR